MIKNRLEKNPDATLTKAEAAIVKQALLDSFEQSLGLASSDKVEDQVRIQSTLEKLGSGQVGSTEKAIMTAGMNGDVQRAVFAAAVQESIKQKVDRRRNFAESDWQLIQQALEGRLAGLEAGEEARTQRVQEAREALEQALASEKLLSMNELAKLSTKGLFDFAANHPPEYVNINKWVTLVVVSLLGGALTTYLAIELSLITFDPNYINWANIGSWVAFNLVAFPTAWLLASKKMWTDYYLKWWNKGRNKVGKALIKFGSSRLPIDGDSTNTSVNCRSAFAK